MGKKQHQKDKLYITNKEWREEWGGRKADSNEKLRFRRLPFNCCSLSFQPVEHPLCTSDGTIFELLNIVPYLKKFGTNPVTGERLSAKELVKLTFSKNADGKIHCPVTFKIFTENSHIVAIKKTGNVYSFDAVDKLNIKTGNFQDLLTNEDFTRKDIITIQDPTSLDKFNISSFHHVKNSMKAPKASEVRARQDPMYTIRKVNPETESTLAELSSSFKETSAAKIAEHDDEVLDSDRKAHYSTGAMASSFTSTSVVPETRQKAATIDKDIVRYSKIRSKAYIRLQTNLGDLNLELFCDQVSKTCENFVVLCKKGYYDNTTFHRLIKNFMIQGGDPTGTGHGGDSMWNKPFEDEFKSNLVHQGRGIVSMANSGKDSNKSQFFITFRSCRHLDNKHTVFGKVVGGMDTLSAMEKVETDAKDKPKSVIKIITTTVFLDPYEELDKEEELKQSAKEEEEALSAGEELIGKTIETKPKVYRAGVGKYIQTNASKRLSNEAQVMQPDQKKTKKAKSGGFGDFSSW